jgi:hypothetical protein
VEARESAEEKRRRRRKEDEDKAIKRKRLKQPGVEE